MHHDLSADHKRIQHSHEFDHMLAVMEVVRIPYVLRKHNTLCKVDDLILTYNGLVSREHVQMLLDCALAIAQHKFRVPNSPPRFSETEAISLFIEYVSANTSGEGSELYHTLVKALQGLLSKFDKATLDKCLSSKLTHTLAEIDCSGLTTVQQLECMLETLVRFTHYKVDDHLPSSICSELLCEVPLFFTYFVAEPQDTMLTKESLFIHNVTANVMDLIIDRFHTEHFCNRPSVLLSNLNRRVPQFKHCTNEELLSRNNLSHGVLNDLARIPDAAAYLPNLAFIYFEDYERIATLFNHYSQAFKQMEQGFHFGSFEQLSQQVLAPMFTQMRSDYGEYDHTLLVYITQLFQSQNVGMGTVFDSLEGLTKDM